MKPISEQEMIGLTAQRVFDRVATHLLSMTERSMLPDGGSGYRGENGQMCAIGVLIPEERYHPSMEGAPIGWLFLWYIELAPLRAFQPLLTSLQQTHDAPANWFEPHCMRAALREIARTHRLSEEALNQFEDDDQALALQPL